MRRRSKFQPRLVVIRYAGDPKENAERIKEARRYLIECFERRDKRSVKK